ncbi:uncharacterized protein LOC129910857 [Episyrphus balteatus]|uniref:uncharacterized protein LOC129910857 n=1 Tax=Episyrphus balteatus TaxID=286459 RepID=UPI002485190B|nr:uncharacterized protein LOC129910857 [Episyrphus balteatus]
MFKFVAFLCVIAVAKAGILTPSLSIAAPPTIVSAAPALNIVRTAPIALGTTTIGAPLGLTSGIISNGLISGGLISNGIGSGGLVSKGLISGGLVSGGIINSGLVSSGKLLI